MGGQGHHWKELPVQTRNSHPHLLPFPSRPSGDCGFSSVCPLMWGPPGENLSSPPGQAGPGKQQLRTSYPWPCQPAWMSLYPEVPFPRGSHKAKGKPLPNVRTSLSHWNLTVFAPLQHELFLKKELTQATVSRPRIMQAASLTFFGNG